LSALRNDATSSAVITRLDRVIQHFRSAIAGYSEIIEQYMQKYGAECGLDDTIVGPMPDEDA
jgi:hypothetical protein